MVPIIALLIGGWMIWRHLRAQGPVARVRFDTAEGLYAGKTEVRCRSVRVGFVKDVKLATDLNSVLINVELDPDYDGLLRRGTRFWVVRPRVSASDVSGLGTLLTGNYIELDPGSPDSEKWTAFKGLETPPSTNRSIPGRRLVLIAEQAGSLAAGSPIYYRGFEVGRIESRTLDVEGEQVAYNAFIREEYSVLVKENTRFWNTSGIDVSAGADGFKLRTPSFQAMVSGGASFGIPDGVVPGKPAGDGGTFTLFKDRDEANGSAFNPTMKFLLLFKQSVRGLAKGAPVEFRGIPIGRVADISFDYLQSNDDSRIPVLVEIDPSLLRREAADVMGTGDMEFLSEAVRRGLRAALKTGSLLTGALYVDVDYYPDTPGAEIAEVGEFKSIPTMTGGLAQMESKVTAILDKIQSLDLEAYMTKLGNTTDEAQKTLIEVKETVAAARKTLDSAEFTRLPADLRNAIAGLDKTVASVGPDGSIQGDLLRTLDELRSSLRAVQTLANSIEEKPNSLLFGSESSGNPVPKAPRRNR